MILTPLQKLPNNVGNLGKIIVATGFEWLPKLQKIAQSGHTDYYALYTLCERTLSMSHRLLRYDKALFIVALLLPNHVRFH